MWLQAVDDEAYDGPWRVELAGVASRIAHLFEHGLIEEGDGVNVVGRVEVDVVQLIDDLAQDVAGPDAVVGAAKDDADDGADIACVLAAQASKIGDQVVIDEFEQVFAFTLLGQAFGDDPIAPAVAPLDNRNVIVVIVQFFLGQLIVVEVFEEQQPDQLGQAVGVTGEAGVLTQQVAYALDGC